MDETLGQGSLKNYPEQIYTKHVRDVYGPFNHSSRGYAESERVVSFDFLNMSASNEPSAITLSGNGQISIATAKPPPPPVRLSSQGSLICGSSDDESDFKVIGPLLSPGSSISEVVESLQNRILPNPNKAGDVSRESRLVAPEKNSTKPLSSREARERALSLGTSGEPLTAEEALTLLTVNRMRCKEGYLFDDARNKGIVADDPCLPGFWDWIQRECVIILTMGSANPIIQGHVPTLLMIRWL